MIPPTASSISTASTQAYYDRLSRWYDLLAGSAEQKCKRKGLELLDARPGETILEIGFGTGSCLLALAHSVGDRGKVYGIDLSTGMLQVAHTRLRKAGLLDRVDLRQGNALQLPFTGSFFDAIYMSFTLELFPAVEIPLVLGECKRVLQSNGRLCLVAMTKKERAGFMVRMYEWAHHRWPVYIDCCPISVQAELVQASFHVERLAEMSLFGLPVGLILASPA
jgi:demethylmenaquinone methyltransferase/2-methoxy-6-polyprenyl-1,4-benzoquinol methylase